MMDDNNEFRDEINDCEDDMTKTGLEMMGKNPGNQLKHLLSKWSEEPVFSQEDLDSYRNELWISLEEFEKYLNE